jgi:hypothetical protein
MNWPYSKYGRDEKRHTTQILAGKPDWYDSLQEPSRRWFDNIDIELKK